MQIHNLFRFADPIFRLGTIGAIKLLQLFARMVREKKLSAIEFEDFGQFLNMIMPDLNKEDGLMQVAVYQPDRDKFGSWYERYLIGRKQSLHRNESWIRRRAWQRLLPYTSNSRLHRLRSGKEITHGYDYLVYEKCTI